MVHDKFEALDSGGDFGERLYAWLYANHEAVDDAYLHANSDIVTGLREGFNQLVDHGAIDGWQIFRFKHKEYNYPCIDWDGSGRTPSGGDIKDFLHDNPSGDSDACEVSWNEGPNGNGTGDNLHCLRGTHLMVHDQHSCDTDWVNAGNYALTDAEGDVCNPDEYNTAFERGRIAWMKGACEDRGQTKNSAIQESLHQLIMRDHPEVAKHVGEDEDGDPDEHTLGWVNDENETSPMLTYHADEFGASGSCLHYSNGDGNYTTELTWCTKEAVKAMKEDPDCSDNTMDCEY